MIESYSVNKIFEAEAYCACNFDGISIAACPRGLIFYQDIPKHLPWFTASELKISFIAMNFSFVSLLTLNGTLMIIPIYTLAGDQFLAAWRKFITKSFFTLISHKNEEGILDTIGGCIAGRDRPFENYLEVSLLRIKNDCLTGMVWSDNFLIISMKNDFLVINSNNGLLEKKIPVKFNITKIELIESWLLINSEGAYWVVSIADLLQDKIFKAKQATWQGKVLSPLNGKINVLYKETLQVFSPDQILCPSSTFWLSRNFEMCIVWNKSILAINPGTAILGKLPLTHTKKINKPLSSKKICICDNCNERINEIDYEEWLKKDKNSIELWKSDEDIGKVKTIQVINYYTTEKTVELITTKGIYSIKEQEIDNSFALLSAIEQGQIVLCIQKTIHQQLLLSETRVSDLGKYLQGLITASALPEIAFRITILSSVYSLSTAEQFLSHKSLHIDLYNYLWASYASLTPSNHERFGKLISLLLMSILEFKVESFNKKEVVLPFEHKNHKPLFGKLDIEAGLCSMIPLLYDIKGGPINEVVLSIVTTHFYKLKTSVQLYLIVVAEQIGLDLPVHKLIITLEKLDLCKILRILAKLANVQVLFSQYDPIFTQDSFVSLLPLPFNSNFSVRTTRIFRKTKTSNTKDMSKLESLISNFLSMFFSIFKSSSGFSSNFCRSLTRFLIIFGYSLHVSKDESLYKLYLGLLERFTSFYDLHDITLSATALRSFVLLSAIYEYKADWVHTVKAKLLLNESDPFWILSHYLKKVKEEDQAAWL